jgi:hypothetical protein
MKRFRLIDEKSTWPGLTPEQAEADRVDYLFNIRLVLRAPIQEMAWLDDAEKSLRVLHALDGKALGDILELEDADHAHLCAHVRNASWNVIDERLVRFCHTVLNATEHVLDEQPDERRNGG